MRKILLVAIIIGGASASFNDAGICHLFFFPGARATAMGGAFMSYADDATSAFYNPACISFTGGKRITAQNIPVSPVADQLFRHLGAYYLGVNPDSISKRPRWLMPEGMHHTYLGAVYPLKDGFTFSLWGSGFYVGEFEYKGVKWCPYDLNISATIAYEPFWERGLPLGMGLAAGVTFKFVYSYLCPDNILRELLGEEVSGGKAWSPTFDMGVLWKGPLDVLRGGISFNNLVGRVKYTYGKSSAPLPRYVRFGLGMKPLRALDEKVWAGHNLTDFVDLTLNLDYMRDLVGSHHDTRESAGVELGLLKTFYLRWGRFREYEHVGYTKGMGLTIGPVSYDISDQARIYYNTEHSYVMSVSIGTAPENCESRFWQRLILNALVPGTGNVLNGDYKIGVLLAALSSLFYQGIAESSEYRTLNAVGLGLTYIISYGVLLRPDVLPGVLRR